MAASPARRRQRSASRPCWDDARRALLVVLARKLFDRRVALVAGVLLALSPFVVKWSQQARGYTLLLAVSVLAILLLLRALERGTRGAWALYGLAFSAVIIWHPPAGSSSRRRTSCSSPSGASASFRTAWPRRS